jgi:hypothetical protein
MAAWPCCQSGRPVGSEHVGVEVAGVGTPDPLHVLLRHRPRSIRSWRLLGLVLPAGGGQRLVSRPVLNASLELVHRRRRFPTGMPDDPYDLPNASALTAIGRRPAGGGQALAVSTAALADHVCDSWHRRQIRFSRRQASQARERNGRAPLRAVMGCHAARRSQLGPAPARIAPHLHREGPRWHCGSPRTSLPPGSMDDASAGP